MFCLYSINDDNITTGYCSNTIGPTSDVERVNPIPYMQTSRSTEIIDSRIVKDDSQFTNIIYRYGSVESRDAFLLSIDSSTGKDLILPL